MPAARLLSPAIPPAGHVSAATARSSFFARAVAVAMLALLAGCGSAKQPSQAAIGFARLDAVAADPADFRAAIRLPQGFGPAQPRANLTLYASRDKGERVVTRVALIPITDGSEDFALAELKRPGFTVTALRIAPADLATLAPFRDSARGLDKLDFTVEPEACRRASTAEPALLTTYLRTDPSASYLMLTREADMEKAGDAQKLPAC